jgi:hypothetical protein
MRTATKMILEIVIRQARLNRVTGNVKISAVDEVQQEVLDLVNKTRLTCDLPPLGKGEPIPFDDMAMTAQDILASMKVKG